MCFPMCARDHARPLVVKRPRSGADDDLDGFALVKRLLAAASVIGQRPARNNVTTTENSPRFSGCRLIIVPPFDPPDIIAGIGRSMAARFRTHNNRRQVQKYLFILSITVIFTSRVNRIGG